MNYKIEKHNIKRFASKEITITITNGKRALLKNICNSWLLLKHNYNAMMYNPYYSQGELRLIAVVDEKDVHRHIDYWKQYLIDVENSFEK